jgi:hypothetical protein
VNEIEIDKSRQICWGGLRGKIMGNEFSLHTHTLTMKSHIYDISHCKLKKKKSIKRTRNRTKVMMWTNWIIIVVVAVARCAKRDSTLIRFFLVRDSKVLLFIDYLIVR